jgi:hypothetical protein
MKKVIKALKENEMICRGRSGQAQKPYGEALNLGHFAQNEDPKTLLGWFSCRNQSML